MQYYMRYAILMHRQIQFTAINAA